MSAINYSKWDNIELSDDEDIECHPNIDKASWIRWNKQAIHQKRAERNQKIEGLKQEHETNKKLRQMILDLIPQLPFTGGNSSAAPEWKPSEKVLKLVTPGALYDPKKTDGVLDALLKELKVYEEERKKVLLDPEHEEFMQLKGIEEVFSMLLSRLLDEHKVGRSKDALLQHLGRILCEEIPKLDKRQEDVLKEISTLEKEKTKKLTSENMYKEGFSKTILNSADSKGKKAATGGMVKEKQIEVLNPNFQEHQKRLETPEASSESDRKRNAEGMPELTLHEEKIMLQFIKCKDFESAYDFIKSYPEIVSRDISDSLLARAFRKQMNGEEKEAYQCCRWSLVLNYCMNLGSDGVSLFFKRMNAVAALQVFEADFDQTWKRIQERCRVLKQKDEEKEYDESNSNLTPEQAAVFKTFPKDFQKAMISGEVEQINAAFSKMSEEQYKEVMEQCQKCGLISVLSKEEADAMVEQEKKAEPEQVSAN